MYTAHEKRIARMYCHLGLVAFMTGVCILYRDRLCSTSSKNGRDKGFTDASHIAGLAVRMGGCRPHMICGKRSTHLLPEKRRVASNGTSPALECYTAPYVRCGNMEDISQSEDAQKGDEWTPIWNLHVHSKHTVNYVSEPCECER